MKLECKCGELVPDSDATLKYRLMTVENWTTLLDTVDSAIEAIEDISMTGDAIMKIRYAEKSQQVWECPHCGRLITMNGDRLDFFRPEDAF